MRWVKDLRFWLLVAAALRLFRIGAGDYWYDEAFSALVVRQDFRTMILALAGDVHPPLWYVLMWLWARFIGGEVTHEGLMRLPSAIFNLVSLYLVWRIASEWKFPDWVRWYVVAWMALSPAQIHYSQEFRMYALLEMEFLAALWCYLRGKDVWAGFWTWTMMWTHYYGLFYTATFMLLVIWHRRNLWPYAVAVMLFAPWAAVLMAQMRIIEGNYWIQPLHPGEIVHTLTVITLGWKLPEWMRVIGAALVPGTLAFAILYRKGKPTWAWWAVPPLLAIAVSILWQPIWLHRAFLPLSPLLAIMTLDAWDTPQRRLFFGLLWGPVLVLLVSLYYAGNWEGKSNFAWWARQFIRENWQGEPLLHTSDSTLVGFALYEPDVPTYRVRTCRNAPGYLSWITKAVLFPIVDFNDALQQWGKVWLLHNRFPMTPPCEAQQVEMWIRSARREIDLESHPLAWAKAWLVVSQP